MLGSNTHLAIYGKNKTDVYVLDVCDTGVHRVSHWVKQAGRTPDSLLLEPRLLRLLLPGWGPWGPGHRHVDLCSLPISQITIPPHLSPCLSLSLWSLTGFSIQARSGESYREAETSSFSHTEKKEEKKRRETHRGKRREGAKSEKNPVRLGKNSATRRKHA